VFLTLISGCNGSAKPADIVGTYRCNYPEAIAIVHLKADGTFTQDIVEDHQSVFRNSGTWRLDDKIENRVNLFHYAKPHNSFGDFDSSFRQADPGEYSYPFRSWFGHFYLQPHPDDAHHLDKIE
jgi:hypothetical protein